MTLPLLSKTWEPHVNKLQLSEVGDELVFHQKILLAIKNLFIGFANNPWIVVGSCNGTSFAMDGTDYWSVFGSLVWGTGNHGWIVLERVDGVQVCWDLFYAVNLSERCDIYMSAGGNYTGGGLGAKPTATDEKNIGLTVGSPYYWMGNQYTAPTGDHRYHVWHSTDGLVTRLVAFKTGVPHTIWRFERLQNPRVGHAVPVGCGIFTSGAVSTDALTVTLQEDNTQLMIRHGAVDGHLHLTGVGYTAKNLVEKADAAVAEEIDNELWFTEIGYSAATVGVRGPKGKAFDMWWGPYQVASSGVTYPNNAEAREFVQFGCFVFVWTGDGTVPLTS